MTVPERSARSKTGDGIDFADETNTGDDATPDTVSGGLFDLSGLLREDEFVEPTESDEDDLEDSDSWETDDSDPDDDDVDEESAAFDDDFDDDDVDENDVDDDGDMSWESNDDSSFDDDNDSPRDENLRDDEPQDEEARNDDEDTSVGSSAMPSSQHSMKPLTKKSSASDTPASKKSASQSSNRSSSSVGATASHLLSAALGFATRVGMKILGFTTSLLTKATKLPLIGKYISKMQKNAALFNAVSVLLPVLLGGSLLGGVHALTVPEMVKGYEFPDGGHLTMEQVTADEDKNVVTAVVYNDGDIIAHDVIPSAKVYSTRLINPVSWISPRKATTCESQMVDTVDIGQKKKVTMTCDAEHTIRGTGVKPQGFFVDANDVE